MECFWFIAKGTTNFIESEYNFVAMVTYLYDNPRNVQCNHILQTVTIFWKLA